MTQAYASRTCFVSPVTRSTTSTTLATPGSTASNWWRSVSRKGLEPLSLLASTDVEPVRLKIAEELGAYREICEAQHDPRCTRVAVGRVAVVGGEVGLVCL